MKQIQATQGQRIYEYVDSDGVVYYSFTRHKATFTRPGRLQLRSRIGVHLVNFLTSLRQVGTNLTTEEDSTG